MRARQPEGLFLFLPCDDGDAAPLTPALSLREWEQSQTAQRRRIPPGKALPEGRTNEEEVRLIAIGKPEPAGMQQALRESGRLG